VPRRIVLGLCLAVMSFVLTALAGDGLPRRTVLVAVKGSQGRQGRLVVVDRWGAYDRSHGEGTAAHFEIARRHLADPARRGAVLSLDAWGKDVLGGTHRMVRGYRLRDPSEAASPERLDDLARAVALQLAWDVEANQEAASWWTGLQLSAWQPEDLPSALYVLVAESPDAGDVAPWSGGLDSPRIRPGPTTYRLPDDATTSERDAFARARIAHASWTRDDTATLPPIFAD